MEIIKPQKKMKTKEQFQDKSNWAIIEHEGTLRLPAGRYHICPICMGPYKIPEQKGEVKKEKKKNV